MNFTAGNELMNESFAPRKNKWMFVFSSEAFWIIAISVLFLFSFFSVLVTRQYMLTHDSINWYGISQYFSESIYNGQWPLWNSYTHAGEPFYYNYVHAGHLNPITLTGIFIGRLVALDSLTLYHWCFFGRIFFMLLGAYLCLRRFYKHTFTRVTLFVVIAFSSLVVISLRLVGILEVLLFVPWILLFMFRIFEEESAFNWILLAVFLGLAFYQYGVVYGAFFLFIFLLTLLINRREDLKALFSIFRWKNIKVALPFVLIIVFLSSPFWTIILFDRDKIVPVVRTIEGTVKGGLFLSLEEISNGGFFWRSATNPRDFLGLVNPFFPHAFMKGWYGGPLAAKKLTESFFYIGILPFFLAVYGIIFGKNKYKLNFLILMIIMAGVMPGMKSVIYIVFAVLCPFIRFARHTMVFYPFFLLTLFYFAGLGLDSVVDRYERRRTQFKAEEEKHRFVSGGLAGKTVFLFFALFFCLYGLREMIGPDIRYLMLFYGLCVFFFLLLARAMSIARFGKTILLIFVITDLLIFNYFNRPLMLMKRVIPFSTAAQRCVFSDRRVFDVAYWAPIPRFKALLFRKPAIEKSVRSGHTSFFDMKNFNKLKYVPDNNMRVIAGVSQPIIGFYRKAVPYRDEHFNMYFMNPAAEGVLREVLFINDVAAVDRDLLWDARVDSVPNDDLPRYKMLKYSPSDIEIETQTQRKSFLYFSDGYDSYWKAYVDAAPVPLYRANINFKAVRVPPGEHTVRFVYRPVFHIIAIWLYFLTLLAVLIYVFLYLIMRAIPRRKKKDGIF